MAPYDNDAALDWLGDLLPGAGDTDWIAQYRAVLDEFAAFELRRAAGTNRAVRTPEEAEYLIGLFDPPDPEMAALIRKGIGEEYQDDGHDETFRLVAAGAVLLAAVKGDMDGIPEEFRGNGLQGATVGMAYREQIVAALRQVPINKPLVCDCGMQWKRNVVELADRLDALSAAAVTQAAGVHTGTPRERVAPRVPVGRSRVV